MTPICFSAWILPGVKEELSVRINWVRDNAQKITDCATLPLEYTWWADADKPFCFLAWAIEYSNYMKAENKENFITTLPIQADCSNSGLQHYSAMMRDEIGGKATNLVPSNKPNDVYGIVAEKVIERLKQSTDPMAKKWLKLSLIHI